MRQLSIAQISLIAAIVLNLAVVGAGVYMFKVMSTPEPEVVTEQKYPVDVIRNELLRSGSVFERVAALAGNGSQPVATPAPVTPPGDLGKSDLTISE
jgi:hypothetical protein